MSSLDWHAFSGSWSLTTSIHLIHLLGCLNLLLNHLLALVQEFLVIQSRGNHCREISMTAILP
jgi:hypothetical protein